MRTTRRLFPLDGTLIASVLLGVLLFSPLWERGIPNTADGMLHLYRSTLWLNAWQEGVFWPRWHTALYLGYGYPLFNFYAPLLYVASSLLGLVLPSSEAAIKGVLLLTCIGYPLGMYLWARDLIGRVPAVVAAAAFAFATYRFRELFVQGNYAQFLAWGMGPWVLFTWRRLTLSSSRGAFLAAVASLTALLFVHNISAMLIAPVAAIYVLWQAVENRATRPWTRLIAAAACSIGMGLAFWLPALLESGDTRVHVLTQGYFSVAEHFITLGDELAVTPWLDGRATNPTLPFNFGRTHLALAGVGALLLLRPGIGRVRRSHLLFALAGGLAGAFLMLAPSLPIWETIPYIAFAEFPTRIYGVAFIFTSLLAGAAAAWLEGRVRAQSIAALLAIFALLLAVVNYQFPRTFLPIRASVAGLQGYEADYNAPGTTSASEYLSRWTTAAPTEQAVSREGTRKALVDPPPGMEATVEMVTTTGLHIRFRAEQPGTATVAQFYTPGWRAAVDGVPVDLRPCTPAGLICVELPAGASVLQLEYAGTRVQRLANILGLLSAGATLLLLVRRGSSRNIPFPEGERQSPARRPGLALATLVGLILVAKAVWIAPRTDLFRFTSPPGLALPAEYRSDLPMGPSVRLIGWDLPQSEVRQGGFLHVRLYWQAITPLEEDYTSFVQLIGGPDQREYGASTAMHAGQIPTSSWNTDFYIVDEHTIPIAADTPPVLFTLRVGLSPRNEQSRIGELDLTPRVRVLPAQSVRAGEFAHASGATFAGGATLLGYDVTQSAAELELTLVWRAGTPAQSDRQLFVHVVDAGGTLLAQQDGAAYGGLYPVRDWLEGEIVREVRRVTLPPGTLPAALLVGFYDLETGSRVPALDAGGAPLPDSAARLELGPAASSSGD